MISILSSDSIYHNFSQFFHKFYLLTHYKMVSNWRYEWVQLFQVTVETRCKNHYGFRSQISLVYSLSPRVANCLSCNDGMYRTSIVEYSVLVLTHSLIFNFFISFNQRNKNKTKLLKENSIQENLCLIMYMFSGIRSGLVSVIQNIHQQSPQRFQNILAEMPQEHAQVLMTAATVQAPGWHHLRF